MSGKKKKKTKEKQDPNSRTVCRNRKARHNYEILEEIACGIALKGSEVKSIRNNKISIEEAYARIKDGEIYLIGCEIAEYPQANLMNHDTKRERKLLLKKKEIERCQTQVDQAGLTLVPTSVFFTRGLVKVSIAIARGRKLYDKREKMKKEDDRKSIRSAMMQ